MDKIFDRYSLQARLFPALIVFLPMAIGAMAWIPKMDSLAKPLLGIVVGAGALILLAHISREAGKSVERKLIKRWGGWPTTLFLRFSDKTIDTESKMRYHKHLHELMPTTRFPSPEEELADPAGADVIYESCATILRSKTRDTTQFPLVFTENINYGFRRNLLGLKWLGVCISVIGIGACLARLQFGPNRQWLFEPLQLAGLAVCLGLLLIWLLVIRPTWVWSAAVDYAKRLIECLDAL